MSMTADVRPVGPDDAAALTKRLGVDPVGERVERVACARAALGPPVGLRGGDLSRLGEGRNLGGHPARAEVRDQLLRRDQPFRPGFAEYPDDLLVAAA